MFIAALVFISGLMLSCFSRRVKEKQQRSLLNSRLNQIPPAIHSSAFLSGREAKVKKL